jgi:hypothetical protein
MSLAHRAFLLLFMMFASGTAAAEDAPALAAEPGNNGTDPTRIARSAESSFEHVAFSGGAVDTLAFAMVQPFGPMAHSSVKVRLPLARNAQAGGNLAIADASVRFTQVLHSTPEEAFAVWAELIFDTAARPELGTGKTVLKSRAIYARFLDDGSILAPTLQHETSLAGQADRADVRITNFTFYIVPSLDNPRFFMTIEPALVSDWERDRTFASVASVLGVKLGRTLGGDLQMTAKPSLFVGRERASDWAIEVGLQLLNF